MASSTGIGRAIAESLIAEGVDVAICSRTEDRLAQTAKEIGAGLFFTCDLTVAGSARELVRKILKAWGLLDILVCNTGGPARSFFVDTSAEDWHTGFQSIWMSVVESSQEALASMIENKWGRIVLLTSATGKEAQPGLTIASCAEDRAPRSHADHEQRDQPPWCDRQLGSPRLYLHGTTRENRRSREEGQRRHPCRTHGQTLRDRRSSRVSRLESGLLHHRPADRL